MKDGIIKRVISVVFVYLSFVSIIIGQTDINDILYHIDIKKNFKHIETINISRIGKELSYLPLETSPQCLIQEIDKILFSKSFIFVNDTRNRLLQFDKNGKFIRQIGSQGRGPAEYLYVYDFCINEDTNEIYIFFVDKMLVFSFEGKYKKSFKLSFRIADAIILDNTSLMFHLPNVPVTLGPKLFNTYSWIITDMQGNPKQKYKNHFMRVGNVGASKTPIYIFDGDARFMEYGVDTLYYFKDTSKIPYALFSYGDLKKDPDPFIIRSNTEKKEELKDKILIWTITENEEFLFIKFSTRRWDKPLYAIYSKKTGKTTFLKDGGFKIDLGVGGGFWPKQIIDDKVLVDYVDAFTLLKNEVPKALKNKLTESSNPVLMILK
jgi:hypothetical protein